MISNVKKENRIISSALSKATEVPVYSKIGKAPCPRSRWAMPNIVDRGNIPSAPLCLLLSSDTLIERVFFKDMAKGGLQGPEE